MKFTRELPSTVTIRSATADGLQIGDRIWSGAIAVGVEGDVSEWSQQSIDHLTKEDFSALLEPIPELIVLGTGQDNRFPPRDLIFSFARLGIGLEAMDTRAAARTFNVLAGEGRRVAAVLMPVD